MVNGGRERGERERRRRVNKGGGVESDSVVQDTET